MGPPKCVPCHTWCVHCMTCDPSCVCAQDVFGKITSLAGHTEVINVQVWDKGSATGAVVQLANPAVHGWGERHTVDCLHTQGLTLSRAPGRVAISRTVMKKGGILDGALEAMGMDANSVRATKGVGRMTHLAGGDGPEHKERGERRALSSREGDTYRRFVGLKPEWEAAPAEDAY